VRLLFWLWFFSCWGWWGWGKPERSGVWVVLYRICASIGLLIICHYIWFGPHISPLLTLFVLIADMLVWGWGVGEGRVYGRIGFMWPPHPHPLWLVMCTLEIGPWFFFFRRQTLTISFPDYKIVYLFIAWFM
jgi:hypothetical protein